MKRAGCGASGVSCREAGAYVLLAASIRAVLLLLDAQPRFFLGDSESYLATAFGASIPQDRSWIYGLAVNRLLAATHSLRSVLFVQSGFTAALCAAVAVYCRALGARRSLCWAALLLTSADPLLAYYERSVMTDQLATATFALGLIACVAVARGGRLAVVTAAGAFWATLCLRTALVPIMVLASAVTLVVRLRAALGRTDQDHRRSVRTVFAPALSAAALLGLVLAGSFAYARATGWVTGSRPSLNPREGYFLLGITAPILSPQDFAGTGVVDPDRLLRETRHWDPSLRTFEVFHPDGLALRLERMLGDWRSVSDVGRIAAGRAMRRDPLGFLRLVGSNVLDYLRPSALRFETMAGTDRELPGRLVDALRPRVRDQVTSDLPGRPSLTLAWFRTARLYLVALVVLAVLAPALALVTRTRRGTDASRAHGWVFGLCTWAYLAVVFAVSPEVVPRYLLPVGPLVMCLFTTSLEALLSRRARQRSILAGGGWRRLDGCENSRIKDGGSASAACGGASGTDVAREEGEPK